MISVDKYRSEPVTRAQIDEALAAYALSLRVDDPGSPERCAAAGLVDQLVRVLLAERDQALARTKLLLDALHRHEELLAEIDAAVFSDRVDVLGPLDGCPEHEAVGAAIRRHEVRQAEATDQKLRRAAEGQR